MRGKIIVRRPPQRARKREEGWTGVERQEEQESKERERERGRDRVRDERNRETADRELTF